MKKSNLVMFPNVDKQLAEKGIAYMHEKKFHEALKIFKEMEALQLNTDNSKFAAVVCLYEIGEYEQALQLAEELVEKNDYQDFQIAQFYMTILVQLNQYEKLEHVAGILQNQTFLTDEMKDQLQTLQNFSKNAHEKKKEHYSREWEKLLFTNVPVEEIIGQLQRLTEAEYEENQHTFQVFLREENTSYLIKTLILEKFKELQINETFKVQKFAQTFLYNPVESESLLQTNFYLSIYRILEDCLGNENPSLFQLVIEYIDHLFMIYYPILPVESEAHVYAAAVHFIGYQMHGIEISYEELTTLYQSESSMIQEKIDEIQDLERKYISMY